MRKWLLGVLPLIGCAALAAQTPATFVDSRPAGGSFGTQDEAISVVGFEEFLPPSSSAFQTDSVGGTRWSVGGDGPSGLYATFPTLPNGAILTQIAFFITDNDPVEAVIGKLCRSWVDDATGEGPGMDCPITLDSGGVATPGESVLSVSPNLPIVYCQDLDENGSADIVNQSLFAPFGPSPQPNAEAADPSDGSHLLLIGSGRIPLRRPRPSILKSAPGDGPASDRRPGSVTASSAGRGWSLCLLTVVSAKETMIKAEIEIGKDYALRDKRLPANPFQCGGAKS